MNSRRRVSTLPCVSQAACLLVGIQLVPQEDADVCRVKDAIAEAQAAAAGARAALEELEARRRMRQRYVTSQDEKAELAAILVARAAWQELEAAAAQREAEGVAAPSAPLAATSSHEPGADESVSAHPSSVRTGSTRLTRTASMASMASSTASGRSRGQPRAAWQAAA